jgi:hypothetical protein
MGREGTTKTAGWAISTFAMLACLLLALVGTPVPADATVHGARSGAEVVNTSTDAERALAQPAADDNICMMCDDGYLYADEDVRIEEDGWYHWFSFEPGDPCGGTGGDPDPDFFDGEAGCRECEGGGWEDCHAEPRESTCGQHMHCESENNSLAAESLQELESMLTPANGLADEDLAVRIAAKVEGNPALVLTAEGRELQVRDCRGITRTSVTVPEQVAILLRSS